MNDAIKKLIIFPLYFITGKTLPGYRLPLWKSFLICIWNDCQCFIADLRALLIGEEPHGLPTFSAPPAHAEFWKENRRRQAR